MLFKIWAENVMDQSYFRFDKFGLFHFYGKFIMYLTRRSLKILMRRLTTAMQIGKGNIFSIASVFISYLTVHLLPQH